MARTITADTFDRWWAALDERARQEGGTQEVSGDPSLRFSAASALGALEAHASPTSLHHDGYHPDGQLIMRRVALDDTVVLDRADEGRDGDEFIEDLIRNIVALTGIRPEYAGEPVPGNDIQPMAERLHQAREARDQ